MLSVFDFFKIGIGPSSSHTMGPMLAGHRFITLLENGGLLKQTRRVQVALYGSLALTGRGHGTMRAVIGGLEGHLPETVDTVQLALRRDALETGGPIHLAGHHATPFNFSGDILLHTNIFLPLHPNGMRFTAFGEGGQELLSETFYSTGGGFIKTGADFAAPEQKGEEAIGFPYPYTNATELFALCDREGLSVAKVVMANEMALRSGAEIRSGLLRIADAMRDSIERGCCTDGILPGGINVRRRAPNLLRRVSALAMSGRADSTLWPMIYAFAVAEENAAGGRVVTGPTNGAAGVVPAVLIYYSNFYPGSSDQGIIDYLLTAGAIGIIYKKNASISGAEVGCQGEVGVACSMAAGAYCAVTGGSARQVEVAAEIGMEHNLGLTCDPVGGLVQVPCIERNGVAAERAIKCAQLSLMENSKDRLISLDQVIQVMYETGKDLQARYRETSLGGLASIMTANARH